MRRGKDEKTHKNKYNVKKIIYTKCHIGCYQHLQLIRVKSTLNWLLFFVFVFINRNKDFSGFLTCYIHTLHVVSGLYLMHIIFIKTNFCNSFKKGMNHKKGK